MRRRLAMWMGRRYEVIWAIISGGRLRMVLEAIVSWGGLSVLEAIVSWGTSTMVVESIFR